MAHPTDEDLMTRFCQGDTTAFDTLYGRHSSGVLAFLTRVSGSRTLAEDLLQTTFMSVVRARDRFDREQRFSSWLYAIAANAARDALRRRSHANEQPSPMEELDIAVDTVMPDPGVVRRVQAALAQLPLAQREAVVLHRIFGWTFEQMAEALGGNAATMRVRAHRGDARLRELLGDLVEEH